MVRVRNVKESSGVRRACDCGCAQRRPGVGSVNIVEGNVIGLRRRPSLPTQLSDRSNVSYCASYRLHRRWQWPRGRSITPIESTIDVNYKRVGADLVRNSRRICVWHGRSRLVVPNLKRILVCWESQVTARRPHLRWVGCATRTTINS